MKNKAKETVVDANMPSEKPQEAAENQQVINESNEQKKTVEEANEEPHGTLQDAQTDKQDSDKDQLTFDEALKRFNFQSEFDRRVNRAIQSALNEARNGWEEQKDKERKAPTEVERLESEISEMKKELALEENRSEAREIAGNFRYKPSNDLIEYAVKEDKEETISNTLILCQLFNDAMITEIKKALSGHPPKASYGNVDMWTKEKILNVSITVEKEEILNFLEKRVIKNQDSFVVNKIKEAIEDSYKRLIAPSIEREIRSELSEKGEIAAIDNFGKNLEALLLTPPMKEQIVLAFDPGFVNGCKLAVIDKNGKYLDSTVIKPFLNSKTENRMKESKEVVVKLIQKYNVDIIAIGNGTASRESEKFCADMIREYHLNCKYVIVSEAGASIYSASKIAGEEFPDLAIEKRSAVMKSYRKIVHKEGIEKND